MPMSLLLRMRQEVIEPFLLLFLPLWSQRRIVQLHQTGNIAILGLNEVLCGFALFIGLSESEAELEARRPSQLVFYGASHQVVRFGWSHRLLAKQRGCDGQEHDG
jgi:hypothetical protein